MSDLHIFSRLVLSGDYFELYTYSSPIPEGDRRKHEIVREDTEKEGIQGKRLDNLLRARQQVRRIIWSNECMYTKFLTLTYAETELSPKAVRRAVTTFVQAMRRRGYEMKYLYVLEHQKKRGAKEGNAGSLHVHMVIFVRQKIKIEDIKACWKHGSENINARKNIKNLGAYVSKYITKDNLDEFGSHVYACSLGLARSVEEVFYKEGFGSSTMGLHPQDVLSTLTPHYHSSVSRDFLCSDGVMHTQVIHYYQGRLPKDSLYRLIGKGVEIVFE